MLILVVALLAIAAWLGPLAVERIRDRLPEGEPTLVRLEEPERGDLVERVQAPGQIEPKTNVEISARVSARIVELPFDEGDRVKANDLVVRLDSADLEARLKAARARRAAQDAGIRVAEARLESQRAQIDSTRAALLEAELNFDRQTGLLESRDVSQSVVDSALAAVDQLKAQLAGQEASLNADTLNLEVMRHNLEVADAEISQAEDELSYTTIRTPIDGIVTRLNGEVGEVVITGTMNNPGTVILEVADLNTMLLVAQVDEADIGALEVGQRAVIRINAYPDREFEGVVDFIALTNSTANDGSKYYRTEILIDTDGRRIYSGLTADVEIETRRHEDILKVPSQAILARPVDDLPLEVRKNNPDVDMTKTFATVVYRFLEGKASVTPVTISASDLTHTVVLTGLNDDDRVIIGPFKELEGLAHDREVKDEAVAAEEKRQAELEKAASDQEGDEEATANVDS
ncbi:MAG: efflux RND transporter periplasmic adaptor subunit [Phycisphaerales bacterium]